MKSPDYSPYAKRYAQSRPGYPDELFQHLASLTDLHNVAWDCAAGSGQAARSLVKRFDKVIATDISSEQIKNAEKHDMIEYRVASSENSGITNQSVNLITAASAVHWFNLPGFYKEVIRVAVPGGVLAVWTYHVGYIESPFDELFLHFYRDILAPYFNEGARLVDNRYSEITLPGTPIESRDFSVSIDWKLADMLNFIESWSGTQHYIKVNKKSPVMLIEEKLKQLWGDPDKIHTLRWPLFLKISRL
jgi:SAM-dependent methyltransferase